MCFPLIEQLRQEEKATLLAGKESSSKSVDKDATQATTSTALPLRASAKKESVPDTENKSRPSISTSNPLPITTPPNSSGLTFVYVLTEASTPSSRDTTNANRFHITHGVFDSLSHANKAARNRAAVIKKRCGPPGERWNEWVHRKYRTLRIETSWLDTEIRVEKRRVRSTEADVSEFRKPLGLEEESE